MLGFFDPLCKLVGGYVYETSFRKHPPNSFFLGLLMWSAHGSILRSRRSDWRSNLGFESSLRIRRFRSSLLEPEIRVRQILVQLGPERLLLISGIQPGFGH